MARGSFKSSSFRKLYCIAKKTKQKKTHIKTPWLESCFILLLLRDSPRRRPDRPTRRGPLPPLHPCPPGCRSAEPLWRQTTSRASIGRRTTWPKSFEIQNYWKRNKNILQIMSRWGPACFSVIHMSVLWGHFVLMWSTASSGVTEGQYLYLNL